jgi:hypothetical protein
VANEEIFNITRITDMQNKRKANLFINAISNLLVFDFFLICANHEVRLKKNIDRVLGPKPKETKPEDKNTAIVLAFGTWGLFAPPPGRRA